MVIESTFSAEKNMCGIAGCLYKNGERSLDLTDSLRLLRHRGPDFQGVWQDKNISLGSTRLSILDLTALGRQPMSYQSGRYHIVFNGEIYNYLELRSELENLGHVFASRTDTEVILASFSQWGKECLQRFRGMFAFALWDKESELLFLARDRVGEKPLYYWRDGDLLCFASELKSLLSIIPRKTELDPVGIDQYLHFQFIPEPRTALTGISKLPAGNYLLFDRRNWFFSLATYWDMDKIEPLTGDPAILIKNEIEEIIKLTLRSDVPIGIALSGGIDSGTIASLAKKQYKDSLKAFTVGYSQRGHYDERLKASELAGFLKLPWHEIELETQGFVDFFPDLVLAMDDPIADIAAFSHYSVNKLASQQGVKVMLNGLGGDELFWGYPWVLHSAQLTEKKRGILRSRDLSKFKGSKFGPQIFNHPLFINILSNSRTPAVLRSLFLNIFGEFLLNLDHPKQAVFYANLNPDFVRALNAVNSLYSEEFRLMLPPRNPYRPFEVDLLAVEDIPVKICKLLFGTWLVSNCLSLQDRVSMSCSVESRVPLLDYRLIEIVVGLMKGMSSSEIKPKAWLKSALSGELPDAVLKRSKQGFQPPVKEWQTAVINKYKDLLLYGYLIEKKVFDQRAIERLFKNRNTELLFRMMVLEVWYRRVLLGETVKKH